MGLFGTSRRSMGYVVAPVRKQTNCFAMPKVQHWLNAGQSDTWRNLPLVTEEVAERRAIPSKSLISGFVLFGPGGRLGTVYGGHLELC